MQSGKHFISYSRADSEFVKKLAIDLKKTGEDVWLDQLDIAPGVAWDECIQKALTEAEGVIVVLSNAFVKSTNVMDEVSYAISKGKKIFPLMIETCPIPFRLARLQYIDFTSNYEPAFDQLLKALNASEQAVFAPSDSPVSQPSNTAIHKSSSKKFIVPIIAIVVVLVIVSLLFKNSKRTNETAAGTPATEYNTTSTQPEVTQGQSTSVEKEGNADPRNVASTATSTAGQVNLLDPANGGEILVASTDDWKNSIDGKEDEFYFAKGGEAVFGFKDNRSATFNTFTILIAATNDRNVKQFELFAGNDSPTGSFQSLGKFQTQNLKLFKTPYQEFKFPEVTAKYFKVKFIDTYTDVGYGYGREIQLFGKLK